MSEGKRPGGLTALAVLNFIFGGLGILRKRIVGYVPETGALFESLTGWEYLQLVASLYHIPEDKAAVRIKRFGQFFDLTDGTLRDKQLGAYSKGMRTER